MLFNSFEFIFVFLPLALAAFYGLARLRLTTAAVYALVAASLAFYAAWNVRFLPILLASVAFNYGMGRLLEARPRRWLLAVGVGANLALLGYFKYAGFFFGVAGAGFLPLGISFITFQKIAFLVDTYRGMTARYRFRDFLLFVTFFPQLIAGPIVHHGEFIPQLQRLRMFVPRPSNLALGAFCFSVGLFKKVVVADTLALWVAPAYDPVVPLPLAEAWSSAVAYALQIFFDFSGYSEMALGLGLLFNLRLPVNFRSPYQAVSIADFWRRWHVTLSAWFNDYVFTPLAFTWKDTGKLGITAATLATFLLSGLWHGAGWTYLLWGGLHGVGVSLDTLTRKLRRRLFAAVPKRLYTGASMAGTFAFVCLALVCFRAGNFLTLRHVLAGLVGLGAPDPHTAFSRAAGIGRHREALALVALYAWVVRAPNTLWWAERFKPTWPWALLAGGLFLAAVLRLERPTAFIYFQF